MIPHAHAMLREIHQQPDVLESLVAHYTSGNAFAPAAWQHLHPSLTASGPLVIAASGSSRHSGLFAELLLEELAGAIVDVEYASEFALRALDSSSVASVLVLSQSGETADTLAALRQARRQGLRTLAITNHPESTMAREATLALPLLAGPEQAIPATKSFLCQLIVLYLLALHEAVAQQRMAPHRLQDCLAELHTLADHLRTQLPEWDAAAAQLAAQTADAQSFLYLGRGIHAAIAREGALKLKESSYVHAEAYPTGELLHGPNALVSRSVPVVLLATCDPSNPESLLRYRRTREILDHLLRQQARVLAVANRDDAEVHRLATHSIPIDPLSEPLLAASEVVPLQLFAYHMAALRGIDMDHPRHLQKAVLNTDTVLNTDADNSGERA